MTSSPPDISSLSLSSIPSQQRLNDTYDYEGNSNARPQYHFATSPGIHSQSSYNPLSLNPSPLKNKPIRSALPTQWLDNSNNASDSRSLSPHNNSDFSSAGGSPPPMGHLNPAPMAPSTPSQNPEDEIIPTAIVIKNIPFNVKRETLLDIIASLSIPTPYAFNYHLDQQGSFRGLAFANFRQAQDADAVVAALNGFDVQGRKLRVEYKKVLQAGEKERIEREKAIRRMRSMQLEKEQNAAHAATSLYDDYGSALSSAFSPGRSFSSGSPYQQPQYSPPNPSSMPTPQYNLSLNSAPVIPSQAPSSTTPSVSGRSSADEVDLNDPSTLEIYSRILVFKEDPMRDELAFSRSLSPKQRRVVHLLAQKLGVYHYSIGEGDERYVVVTRFEPQRQQPPVQQSTQRQVPHTLSRAPSAYLTPTGQVTTPNTLRAKKSMPDMKTLHSQAPRLSSRASNGNIREGYATIASPSRRVSSGFSSLFSNGGSPFGNGTSVPPVPSLPSSISSASLNGGHEASSNVVRQPRGPGIGGFGRRDSRVGVSESQTRGSTLIRAAFFAAGALVGGGVATAISSRNQSTVPPRPALLASDAPLIELDKARKARLQEAALVPSTAASSILKYGNPGPISDTLVRQAYITAYDRRLRHPAWTAEHLTQASLKSGKGSNEGGDRSKSNFIEDESLPGLFRARLKDYFRSGYDRGHMVPAADAKFSQEAMDETFLLSNIAPQVGDGFNRHYWAYLEDWCRRLTGSFQDVYIFTVPLYLPRQDSDGKWRVTHEVIGSPPNVAVPTHFAKVVLTSQPVSPSKPDVLDISTGAFVLPNAIIPDEVPLESFVVPVDAVERAAGLTFFSDEIKAHSHHICKSTKCQLIVRRFDDARKQSQKAIAAPK
ncbi:hypothetical protein C0995_001553 [Termitomyces sp. Mi166|nr:hypothetical protein C0995_001553 [Termitomyces sp. Mi166\